MQFIIKSATTSGWKIVTTDLDLDDFLTSVTEIIDQDDVQPAWQVTIKNSIYGHEIVFFKEYNFIGDVLFDEDEIKEAIREYETFSADYDSLEDDLSSQADTRLKSLREDY